MSQQLDEKRHVIIPILTELRSYNPNIGNYDTSVMNGNFNYTVRLDNGRIEVPESLVYDYERAPLYITPDRYRAVAEKFVPNQEQKKKELKPESSTNHNVVNEPGQKPKSRNLAVWTFVLIVIIAVVIYFLTRKI